MPLRAALVLGCAFVVSGSMLFGQSPQPAPQTPVFRASAELVEVDVVVVDQAGNPVHGLTKDDFVLRDRNRPQTIETFQEVRRETEPVAPIAALPAATRRDVASNTSNQAGRLIVVVLDDLHTYRGRTETVREIARKIVADLGPASSMALLQTGGEHGVEVTDDRSRLLESIARFTGRRNVRRPTVECTPRILGRTGEEGRAVVADCDLQDYDADTRMMKTLQDAARLLGGGDRRRKAFVFVSESIGKDLSGLFQVDVPPARAIADGSSYINSGGGAEAMANIPFDLMGRYDTGLLDMMEAMRRGGVATYSIDPRGEVTSQEMMLECHPAAPADQNPPKPDPCLGGIEGPADWTAWFRQAQHGLEILSEASGGFAVVNTDDFTGGIARIVSDLDNYYLLGFYTPDTKAKGYRRLAVEVRGRPELTLRYRRGYQLDTNVEPARRVGDPLSALASTALPKADLPMRLYAVPMPHTDKEARVAIVAELTVPRRAIEGDGQRLLDEIRFAFYAIDMKGGKVREQFGRGARIGLVPARTGPPPDEVTYAVTTMLPLPPGRYQLRASALSTKLDKGGSVYLSMDVPDFSSAPLALTDLVLGYADGSRVPVARVQAASPARAMAGMPAAVVTVVPFDPTLDREFSSRDVLRLFFRVAGREPGPVTATISALAPDGRVILTFDRAMPPENPASLDIRLPLAQLAPGGYRLRVSVANGAHRAEREVAIAVK